MTGRTADGRIETVTVIPDGSPVANYGFDVTPARLVTGLITERGVLPATREGLAKAFPERATERARRQGAGDDAQARPCAPRWRFAASVRPSPSRTSQSSIAPSTTRPTRSSCWSGWSTSIPAPAMRKVCVQVGAIAVEELRKLGATIEIRAGQARGRRQHRRHAERHRQGPHPADGAHRHGVRARAPRRSGRSASMATAPTGRACPTTRAASSPRLLC